MEIFYDVIRDAKYFTDFRYQNLEKASFAYQNGVLVSNETSNSKGISSRVMDGRGYGFAASNEVSEKSLREILKASNENLSFLKNGKSKNLYRNQKPFKFEKNLDLMGKIELDILKDVAKKIDSYIEKNFKNLVSRSVRASVENLEKRFLNTEGVDFHTFLPKSVVIVTLYASDKEGGTVMMYQSFGGFGVFRDNFKNLENVCEKLDEIYKMLMDKTEAVYSKPGTHDLVVGSSITGILAHEAIGHTVEADLVSIGSVADGLIGDRVATDIVNLSDLSFSNADSELPCPIYVDDEGVMGRDVKIIEKGILKNYLHMRESAESFGVEPMGNGRANEYYDEVLVRMRNTCIESGDSSLDEMISSIDDGYYLVKSLNGQADTTGEFMFGISMGYEIKNGKLGRAIKDTTLSGLAFDVLKTVTMVGDDMEWSPSAWCGKKQLINVGMGGPSVKLRAKIGGRL